MGIQAKSVRAVAALVVAVPCSAAQWFAVESPAGGPTQTLVEVDLESIAAREGGGAAVIRVSYGTAQQHGAAFQYQSLVGNAEFKCRRRSITLSSAAYYALPRGEGQRLAVDSVASVAGMPSTLLRNIPAAALQALLRATCATTSAS